MYGQGDIDLRLVDKETWEWIHSDLPDFPKDEYDMVDPSTPDNVKKGIFRACYQADVERGGGFPDDPKKWEDVTVHVSTGSGDNDRMLASFCFLGDISLQFFSVSELNKFVKEHNVEIVEETEGCIY